MKASTDSPATADLMTIAEVEAAAPDGSAWLMRVRCKCCGGQVKVLVATDSLVAAVSIPFGQLVFWGMLDAAAHRVMAARPPVLPLVVTPLPDDASCATSEVPEPVEPKPDGVR